MTFASEIHNEILDHQPTDEYSAALQAMERGEPKGRARVLDAYAQMLARSLQNGR